MGIPYKKIPRKNPRDAQAAPKYYPQLVTLGQTTNLSRLAVSMKEKSSLSLGDIKSVLTNFVEAMQLALYDGKAVNIADFGVFTLSARTKGVEKKEDCTAKNIEAVRINFRSSTSIRPSLADTRADGKMEFIDIESVLEAKKKGEGSDEENPGGGEDKPGGGEAPEPGI